MRSASAGVGATIAALAAATSFRTPRSDVSRSAAITSGPWAMAMTGMLPAVRVRARLRANPRYWAWMASGRVSLMSAPTSRVSSSTYGPNAGPWGRFGVERVISWSNAVFQA